jgi:hypothetical protein
MRQFLHDITINIHIQSTVITSNISPNILANKPLNVSIFWDKAPFISYVNRRFEGRRFLAWLIFTVKMVVIPSFETSVHMRTTRHYIPGDGNIHNYSCENLKSWRNVWHYAVHIILFNQKQLFITFQQILGELSFSPVCILILTLIQREFNDPCLSIFLKNSETGFKLVP